ncbi:MAG: SAM-dependent methyltransferase [Candidatus Micrarchaeota archaeon]|nr:SAM-dependent methyltransferase [Candidatus Micrarchaeota archaeon]
MPTEFSKANRRYYSCRGGRIYLDFSTFAQGKCLARCNAIEFCRDFASHPAPIVVCEYGVGRGDFARTFLDEVKKRNKRLYSRTRYYLFDFSEKMLSSARKNLRSHRKICVFGKFDASCEQPDLRFDYCRINELLSDLPPQICMKKGGRITDAEGKEIVSPSPVVSSFLSRVEEGRQIPFSFSAEKFLLLLSRLGKAGFRIDVFDYGFYFAEDILPFPVEEWNRLAVRSYGGQLTADLNFPQLLSALEASGVHALIEKQKFYCEKILGRRLRLSHTKSGLDYAVAKKGESFCEDDGFYHLRAGR